VYYTFVTVNKNPISGLGGVALTRYMDGRTDRVIPIKPPYFVCGGWGIKKNVNINMNSTICKM
jgi:hypothetical protein